MYPTAVVRQKFDAGERVAVHTNRAPGRNWAEEAEVDHCLPCKSLSPFEAKVVLKPKGDARHPRHWWEQQYIAASSTRLPFRLLLLPSGYPALTLYPLQIEKERVGDESCSMIPNEAKQHHLSCSPLMR